MGEEFYEEENLNYEDLGVLGRNFIGRSLREFNAFVVAYQNRMLELYNIAPMVYVQLKYPKEFIEGMDTEENYKLIRDEGLNPEDMYKDDLYNNDVCDGNCPECNSCEIEAEQEIDDGGFDQEKWDNMLDEMDGK